MSSSTQTTPSQWLKNPFVDLLIGCGAWSAPLLLLVKPFAQQSIFSLSVAFYLLSLFFNYPHYMATIYRAYRTREDFSKYRLFTLHLTVLMILSGILIHAAPRLLPLVFTLYITWSPWHYMGQNFGLFMMFARRTGAQPTPLARNLIYTAFVSSYLILFCSFHQGTSSDAYVLSLGIPVKIALGARVVLLIIFSLSALIGLGTLVRQAGIKAMIAPTVLLSTEFLWFVLPSLMEMGGYLANVPQTRYTTGLLAFLHSTQYLWITSYYAKRETQASGGVWRPWLYMGTLVIGGMALFVPGPWAISYIFHYDFTSSFLVFTALINLHHFILDGAIWKLRDGRIATLLVNTKAQVLEQTAQMSSLLDRYSSWRKHPLFRFGRIGVIVLLLILVGIDQVKFFLGFNEDQPTRLASAETLNPYDAVIKMRIALAKAREGQTEQTIAKLENAVALNPYLASYQTTLAQVLIEQGRYAEAYQHYQQMSRHISLEANDLVNFGILANQLQHPDEAMNYWQQALKLDAQQYNAHLYLGEIYFNKGSYQETIQHYEAYLIALANLPAEQRPAPTTIVPLVLKLAEAYVNIQTPDRAVKYYEQAVKISEQSGAKSLESFSYVKLAEFWRLNEQPNKAIQCYKKVLTLDAEIKDDKLTGSDWFNYGQLLAQVKAPPELVLACFIKAETLLKDGNSEALAKVTQTREQLVTIAHLDVEQIRNNLASYEERLLKLNY